MGGLSIKTSVDFRNGHKKIVDEGDKTFFSVLLFPGLSKSLQSYSYSIR